jgi:hypothetical protein
LFIRINPEKRKIGSQPKRVRFKAKILIKHAYLAFKNINIEPERFNLMVCPLGLGETGHEKC